MNLYINLLNFNDSRIAGVGTFMKGIFQKLEGRDKFLKSFSQIIILHSANINIKDVLLIPDSNNVVYKKVNFIHFSVVFRILYEQIVLPLLIKKTRSVYFSPNPVIPIFLSLFDTYLICTIHDLIPFKISTKYNRLRSIYVKFITKYSAKYCDKIVTVSNYSKYDIVGLFNIDDDKIIVIYNYVNIPFLKEISAKENFIISICTIEPGKNIESMLLGFEHLITNFAGFSDYKYYIVGKPGWNFHSIYKLVEKLDLSQNVVFTGYIDNESKFDLLKKAKCLMFLSKYEGFGIPILESIYCRTPCLILNNSSLPEVMGNSGIIIEQDNPSIIASALKELILNYEYYLGDSEFHVNKFDSEVQIEKFESLFFNY